MHICLAFSIVTGLTIKSQVVLKLKYVISIMFCGTEYRNGKESKRAF